MDGRAALKFTALAFIGTAVIAGPANAIPITLTVGPGSTNVTGGATPGDYILDVTGPGTTYVEIDVNSSTKSPPLLVSFNGAPAQTVSFGGQFDHFYTLTAGDYTLDITTGGKSDAYSLTVTATPLPPALILFGTALAGLSWLGLRRRENAGAA
jgi:hypothetical protein